MKYVNANTLLPAVLVEELQGYIQGGYIYVPVRQDQPKHWGELSGYREELEKRNREIIRSFKAGDSMEYLAEKYYLSVYAIRMIIYLLHRGGRRNAPPSDCRQSPSFWRRLSIFSLTCPFQMV